MKRVLILITGLLLLISCKQSLQTSDEKQSDENPIIDIPKTFEPYEIRYTQENYSIPFSTAYLGSGYQTATKLFRNEAISIGSTRRIESSKYGCTFSPTLVRNYAEALSNLSYFNECDDKLFYLGEKTKAHLTQIEYNDNNVTCIYGSYVVGYYEYISDYSMLDEAMAYYQVNGVSKFYEKYGDMFCKIVNTGVVCTIIETYKIHEAMDESEKQEIKAAIRYLHNGISDVEEKNKTIARIERPGVTKVVHFFTTFKDESGVEIVNAEDLHEYIMEHMENGELMDDAYSIVGFKMEKYNF